MLVSPLYTQATYSPQEVIDQVRKKYSSLETASASFTQKITGRFAKGEQIHSGIAKIKKGNKYRIETDEQKIISNGKTVWMVTLSNKQVLISSYKENSRLFSPDKFLSGLPEDFSPLNLNAEGNFLKLSLKPKLENAQTRQVKLLTAWVNPSNWFVERIEYVDRSQTTFNIALSNIALNIHVSDKEFEFEPSTDMKVIDMREMK